MAKQKSEHRIALYSCCMLVCGGLLLAGFVYKPSPNMTINDYEASITINMTIGNIEGAEEDIRALLKKDPFNLYAILTQAYIYSASDEPKKALSWYKNAKKLIQNHPDLEEGFWDSISLVALQSSNYEEAKEYAAHRIDHFGENVLSRLIIALSCLSLKDDKAYEENYDRALDLGFTDPAFKIQVDSLLKEIDKRQIFYLQGQKDRARYEYQWLKLNGM